jgi:hypothetical protein
MTSQLPFQVEVLGVSTNGSWLVIRLPLGAEGWVWSGNLSGAPADASLPPIPVPPKPAATVTPVPAPLVLVSPTALAPGSKYTISLSHFIPYERITVKVVFEGNGFMVFKVAVVADANGKQEVALNTSTLAPQGAYLVTATGDAGSYAQSGFFVGPPVQGGGN